MIFSDATVMAFNATRTEPCAEQQHEEITAAVPREHIAAQRGCAKAIATSTPSAPRNKRLVDRRAEAENKHRAKQITPLLRRIHPAHQQASTAITHGTPNSEIRLMTTDSLHMSCPNPSANPRTTPETTQMAFSHLRLKSLQLLDALDQHAAAARNHQRHKPQPIAAANASPTSTRQATLPTGTSPSKARINRPERITRRMRNARVKRAGAKFAGIFQRQFRRQGHK